MDNDKSQLEKFAELMNQQWGDDTGACTGLMPYQPHPLDFGGGCPSCGYCRSCGRGGRHAYTPYFTFTCSTQAGQNFG